jgi:C1A family cysteine protease
MKKNHIINNDVNIVKKLIIYTELLVLFLVINSSIAMAYTGFSEENKPISVPTDHKFIHKDSINQTKFSTNVGLAPENPKFTQYRNNKSVYKMAHSSVGHKSGFAPSPVDLSHLKHTSVPDIYASANTSIPTFYDLRTLNRVTPVKNQGSAGSCWTFATDGSLESYLMPGETWSFSENNIKNVLSSANSPQGFDRGPSDGGDFVMSTAYEARWSGPVNTSDDPYSATSSFSSSELGLPVHKHVQNVTFLPNRNGPTDNQDIKEAIMNYGAVATALYFDPTDTTSYNQNTYGYYYSGTTASDHAVTIVGWNDDYSASNFSTTPPGNGAFIIKNSWGTTAADWGNVNNDNGYFYVSYYDSNVGYNMNTFFTAENPKDYTNIYQYDPLGWTQQINTSQNNPTTGWGANIFTANSNEVLKAVSFYTTDLNCNYVINIYNNIGSNPISQTGPALTQSGTISSAGYHTVPLNSGVQLNAGQKFSVVLELTNPTYQYPIPVEMPISGHSSQATANASESFVSSDGNTWTDITTEPGYSNTDVCIKAFTDPESSSEKGLPIANFNTNVTNGNVPLTVQFTDLSTDATGWGWDFGDGATSTELNPTHTYLAAGVYTVNETVSNTNGTNSMLATINILTTTPQNTTPTITWSNPTDIVYGTPLSSTQLDATATVPGTFAYIPSAGTVLNVGTQMLNVLFIPTDLVHYNIASKTVTIKVTDQASNLYPYPGNLYPYPGNLYPYPGNLYPYRAPLVNGYLWHHHH